MKSATVSLLFYYSFLRCLVSHLDALVIQPSPSAVAYATQQGTLNLSCTCQDCTPGACAQIAWYQDNVPIDPSWRSLRVSNDNSSCTTVLGFDPVQAEQSGWYTCAATDAWERTEKDFLVIVNSPPVLAFNSSYFIIYAALNTSITLPCPVSGIPVPVITWYKNITSGGVGGTQVSSGIDNVTGSLIITTESTPSEMFFKCTASNGYGNQSITVALISNNSLPSTDTPQPISSGIDSTYFKVAPAPYTSVMAGRTINLVCSINFTNPPIYYDLPALSWLSGDTALANTTTVTVLQNSKAFSYLSIRDAQPSNSLVYSCSNGTRAVTTNLTVLSGCGLSDTVKSPGAEGSEKDISENWSFSGSYAANVNGENCFVATYNGSSGQYPSIEQEISGPARSTKLCISARIRQVGSPMVTPMVCLLVVEANNTTRRVTCLAHPFPSSPAWYWVQREIGLPEEGIETTHVKLKIVLTVDDTSTGAAGVAYFDDITASFSGSPPQLFISFTVSLCSAMVLVFCFVVCQLCSVRKSGITAKAMKKLTMKLSKKKKVPPQEDSAVPYMTRLIQDKGTNEKPKTPEEGTEEYYYVDDINKIAVFFDQNGSGSTAIVVNARASLQDKQPNPTASTGTAPKGNSGTSSVNGNPVPEVSVKQLIAAINQPASMDGDSRKDTVSLQKPSSVNSNPVPEVSVKQLIAAINHSTASPDKNLVPKATDITVKTENEAYLLPAEEYEPVETSESATSDHQSTKEVKSRISDSGHKMANEPRCLSAAVLPPTAEYEAVDMPEPAIIPSGQKVEKRTTRSTCATTAPEEYEPVEMPEQGTRDHQSTKDVKSLFPDHLQPTDIYELVEMPEQVASPNKKHTSVSVHPPPKDRISLSSAALPQTEEYEITDIPTYSKRQSSIRDSKKLLPAEPGSMENSNYMALIINDLASSDTYDSVIMNKTALPSDDESEHYL